MEKNESLDFTTGVEVGIGKQTITRELIQRAENDLWKLRDIESKLNNGQELDDTQHAWFEDYAKLTLRGLK